MSALIKEIKRARNYCCLQPAGMLAIEKAENQLGIRFADDYKDYLLAFGTASFNGRELTGICDSERLNVVSATEKARCFYHSFPYNVYVIEEMGFDNIIIGQDTSGNIYSFGPDETAKKIAGSLYEYLFSSKMSNSK